MPRVPKNLPCICDTKTRKRKEHLMVCPKVLDQVVLVIIGYSRVFVACVCGHTEKEHPTKRCNHYRARYWGAN